MLDGWIENEFLVKNLGDGFARQVIAGRSQSTRGDDQVGALPGFGEKGPDLIHLITNHEVGEWFDPMMGKLSSKVGKVCVFANAQEQFVSEGDGFNANGQTHGELRWRKVWRDSCLCSCKS